MKKTALGIVLAAAMFAASAAASGESGATIRDRQRVQQHRIAQGVNTGQLTPRETARLERREAAVNREIRRDRARGGGLGARERTRIGRQQNRLSREIYREKHDAWRTPPAK